MPLERKNQNIEVLAQNLNVEFNFQPFDPAFYSVIGTLASENQTIYEMYESGSLAKVEKISFVRSDIEDDEGRITIEEGYLTFRFPEEQIEKMAAMIMQSRRSIDAHVNFATKPMIAVAPKFGLVVVLDDQAVKSSMLFHAKLETKF